MSTIFDQLISGSRQNAPQAELLETLGKKAAAQFLNDKAPLNESIVKLASEYPNLGNEHVKRIAEFANNAVFQGLHSRNEDKNVHFPIADPGTIIQDLRDGGSPAHNGKTMNTGMDPSGVADYSAPPPSVGSGEGNNLGFHDASSGVPAEGLAKMASSRIDSTYFEGHANPVEDVFDTHIRLRATREKLAEAHENFDMALKTAKEDFYQGVKEFVIDADSPGLMSVVNAVKLASPSDSFAFQVLKTATERLVVEGAIRPSTLTKTASQRVVNMNHPIMVAFCGIMKMAEEKVRSREALAEADKALVKTATFLRENVQ